MNWLHYPQETRDLAARLCDSVQGTRVGTDVIVRYARMIRRDIADQINTAMEGALVILTCDREGLK